jgi:ribosomal protein S18 acetylase RimI-like enzyme
MMEETGFRHANDGDGPILREMLYHALYVPEGGEPFPRSVLSEPRIKAYIDYWGRPGDNGVIAMDRLTGKPVGAIWVRLFERDNPGHGFVEEMIPELAMAVIPGRRGEGIGTELLRRQLDVLDERERAVSLSVSVENPARRLYVRHGFEVVGSFADSLTMIRRAR